MPRYKKDGPRMTTVNSHHAGKLAEFPAGQIKLRKIDGRDLALANVAGRIYAFSNECTHSFQPLSVGYLQDYRAVCIFHRAMFDIRDGSVLQGPAFVPLEVFEVVVENDDVNVVIPGDE